MISKEWRDARWKLAVVALLVIATLVFANLPTPYTDIVKVAKENSRSAQVTMQNVVSEDGGAGRIDPASIKTVDLPTDPVEMSVDELWLIYSMGGGAAMVLLAGLLGVSLVSGEVDRNTIFLLLSKPISRTRLLLIKYAVCAAVLLVAVVLGSLVLFAAAWARGYPLEEVSVTGVLLSVMLIWLGSLFVLGVSLAVSTLFGDVLKSLVIAAVVLYFMLAPDSWINYALWDEYHALGLSDSFPRTVTLFYYWLSDGWLQNAGFTWINLLVSLISAAIPLLLALWMFNRKAY